jgi:surface antigen
MGDLMGSAGRNIRLWRIVRPLTEYPVDRYTGKWCLKRKEDKILGKGSLKSLSKKILAQIDYFKNSFLRYFSSSFLILIFLTSLVLFGNFKEKSLAFSFFEEEVYPQDEIERFITSVSSYTPIIEEEPSLAAENLIADSIYGEEFLEKPLLSTTLASSIPQAEQRRGIITYTVVTGDTVSKIASKFGLKLKTLADSNNLSSVNQIKPGQTLLIPPIDGILHTVSKGDTLSSIVKKYQGDLNETLKYNPETLLIGQKVVVVGGKPYTPPTTTRLASSRNVIARERTGKILGASGSRYNGYPWGWCTWYAAYRRNVPGHWGNAGRWLASASAAGYATGSEPRAGAIIVTRETWLGHVGYVESVHGDSITISEMNYKGWGIISSRTISRYNPVIKGYIY